jgi:hypothetical protein
VGLWFADDDPAGLPAGTLSFSLLAAVSGGGGGGGGPSFGALFSLNASTGLLTVSAPLGAAPVPLNWTLSFSATDGLGLSVEAPAVVALTPPVKKFGVVRVSSPPSDFVRPPVPVRTVSTDCEPVVVTEAVVGPLMIEAPEAALMTFETLKLARSRDAPLATVTAPEPSEPAWPMTSVPALTVVPPPKVLAPERVRVPAPILIREPWEPASRPANVPPSTVRSRC